MAGSGPRQAARSAQPRSETSAVSITGLEKSFGPTRALKGVDLWVAQGECHALLGRNGAGKSTLIGILTGLVEADGGVIEVAGAGVVSGPAAVGDVVACVYQKSTLVPDLTVAENITLGSYPRTPFGMVDWRRINRTAVELLDETAGHVGGDVSDADEFIGRGGGGGHGPDGTSRAS